MVPEDPGVALTEVALPREGHHQRVGVERGMAPPPARIVEAVVLGAGLDGIAMRRVSIEHARSRVSGGRSTVAPIDPHGLDLGTHLQHSAVREHLAVGEGLRPYDLEAAGRFVMPTAGRSEKAGRASRKERKISQRQWSRRSSSCLARWDRRAAQTEY
jgi:hypothetical protein